MKNKSWIVVTKDEGKVPVKRYRALFDTEKNTVRLVTSEDPEVVVNFKSTKSKPAVHMAREAAMVAYKKYDPQIHSVTVCARDQYDTIYKKTAK